MEAGLDGSSRRFAGGTPGSARDGRARRLREHAFGFARTLVPALADYIATYLPEGSRSEADEIYRLLDDVRKKMHYFALGREIAQQEANLALSASDIDRAYNDLVHKCVELNLPLGSGSRGSFLLRELFAEISGISEFLASGERLDEKDRSSERWPIKRFCY